MTLEVFNTTGALVAALFENSVEAGRVYKVNFNAEKLARGLYIYTFRVAGRVYSRRLVVAD